MEWPRDLQLHVGEVWTLHLPGYSSGGYRWTAEVEPPGGVAASVSPTGDASTPGSRDELVTICATAAGRATVTIALARSWELDPIEHHAIEVNVAPSTDTTP